MKDLEQIVVSGSDEFEGTSRHSDTVLKEGGLPAGLLQPACRSTCIPVLAVSSESWAAYSSLVLSRYYPSGFINLFVRISISSADKGVELAL